MYKRKDGLYIAEIIQNDKRHTFTGKTENDVIRKIFDFKEKLTNGRMFFDVAYEWKLYHFEQIAIGTRVCYNPAFKRLIEKFKKCYIKDITSNQIQFYINEFAKQGYSKHTVKIQLIVLKLIYNYALLTNDVTFNPTLPVKIPKNLKSTIKELPQLDEIETIKNSIDCNFGFFAYFLLYTGCRRGEALAVKYEDIDRENYIININKSIYYDNNRIVLKTPKTNSGNRDIIILDNLLEKLPNQDTGYIFNVEGQPLTHTMFVKRWNKYKNETGITITPHQLRHEYATMLFEAGIDDKDAQGLLGHASILTSRNIYTHLRKKRIEETRVKLNQYLQKNT